MKTTQVHGIAVATLTDSQKPLSFITQATAQLAADRLGGTIIKLGNTYQGEGFWYVIPKDQDD